MAKAVCLSEIDDTIIFESPLIGNDRKLSQAHCVLAGNHFIVFKKPTDFISFLRIPISAKTKIENLETDTGFSLTLAEYSFQFRSQNSDHIRRWTTEISKLIKNNVPVEPFVEFNHAEVRIDQFHGGRRDVYILNKSDDYKLYVYDSLEYHRMDIVCHVINFKFYALVKRLSVSSMTNMINVNKTLGIIGRNQSFKITFKDDNSVSTWKTIFQKLPKLSIMSSTDRSILMRLHSDKSNQLCADCGAPNPEWVSTTFCVVVCVDCCGLHRHLHQVPSRIKSANIDNWDNCSNLVDLLMAIGNANANKFWKKTQKRESTNENANFVVNKYEKKLFIDKEFQNLTKDEMKTRLKESVGTENVIQTMRLWFSVNFPIESEFVDELNEIAKNSHQVLQETFLSMQHIPLKRMNLDSTLIVDIAVEISLNKNPEKLNNLFQISLLHNCISIKCMPSELSTSDNIINCCIKYDNIDLFWYNADKQILEFSINPSYVLDMINPSKVFNTNTDIHWLSVNNQSKLVLQNIKIELMKILLPNSNDLINDSSILFGHFFVKRNLNEPIKCKCFVTKTEILLFSPNPTSFDLRKSWNLVDVDEGIQVRFENDQFNFVITNNNTRDVFNYCLDNVTKSDSSFSGRPVIPVVLERMIDFLWHNGLKSREIFQIDGQKSDELWNLIRNIPQDGGLTINSKRFDVNDVASCLKKYLQSLDKPIIADQWLDLFKDAAKISGNHNDIIDKYQQALRSLPKSNYNILWRLVELFYVIQRLTSENNMTSVDLAAATATSLVSFDMTTSCISIAIVTDLIDNFLILFEYSEKECQINDLFIKKMTASNRSTVIRTFYISPTLSAIMTPRNSEKQTVNFVGANTEFLVVTIGDIDRCVHVREICLKIFLNNFVDLWQFLCKSANQTIKRLIYLDENVQSTIIRPKTVPGFTTSHFVFLPKICGIDLESTRRHIFSCDVKLKFGRKENFKLNMTSPNLLEFTGHKAYRLKLSDVIVYRFQSRNACNKILIVYDDYNDDILNCTFARTEELREFLYYFEQFRSHRT